jgi:hypothetical protein
VRQILKSRADKKNLAECRLAADRGDAKAQYRLAMMYHQGKGAVHQDYAQALSWYRKAAAQGEAGAEYGIGYMYFNGQGVTQDYAEALRWYRLAAEAREAKAQYAVGLMYFNGYGVQQSSTEASKWYRLAADQGLPSAQYDLGYLYYYGIGVQKDHGEADRWFVKAADQGNKGAESALGRTDSKLARGSQLGYMIVFLGSSILIITAFLQGPTLRSRRQRVVAGTGLVGLSYVGMGIIGPSFERAQSELVIDGFHFLKGLLVGAFFSLFIYLFWNRASKRAMQICGALFIVSNTYMIVRFGLNFSSPALLLLCSTNGVLIGALGPLIFLQWQTPARGNRGVVSKAGGPP